MSPETVFNGTRRNRCGIAQQTFSNHRFPFVILPTEEEDEEDGEGPIFRKLPYGEPKWFGKCVAKAALTTLG